MSFAAHTYLSIICSVVLGWKLQTISVSCHMASANRRDQREIGRQKEVRTSAFPSSNICFSCGWQNLCSTLPEPFSSFPTEIAATDRQYFPSPCKSVFQLSGVPSQTLWGGTLSTVSAPSQGLGHSSAGHIFPDSSLW